MSDDPEEQAAVEPAAVEPVPEEAAPVNRPALREPDEDSLRLAEALVQERGLPVAV